MRIELKAIETIERYLMGTLPGNEKADFESQMNQNAQLKQQVELQSQIMQGVQRMALKNSTQQAYKSYKLQSFLTKLVVIAVIAAGATFGVMKLLENDAAETPAPTEYHETQNQIQFPKNDSLAADANQYLLQEIFSISTQHDTIIETENGLVIYIPADAFNTTEQQVDLLIQDATTAEDILMAGLSTVTADGQELETGGMFYIDAYVDGKRVDLKKELTVSVPSSEQKAGMQLYEGEKNANGEIVWNNPKPLESFLTPIEITELDFYPPNYEASLNEMGYSEKTFMDSLYYSFACSEGLSMTTAVIESMKQVRYMNERGRTELKDRLRQADSMTVRSGGRNGNMPASVDEIVQIGTRTTPMGNGLYELEVTATIKDGWTIGEMSNYSSIPAIDNTEIYFGSEGRATFISGPYESFIGSTTNTSGNTGGSSQRRFTYYVKAKNKTVIEGVMVFMACDQGACFPPKMKNLSFNLSGEAGPDFSCPGINPASIKTIWNDTYNNTNLATREFEERMPWIHKSCNNKVLELYINNLDKKLCTVDSMALSLLSGEVLEKFKAFAARGDGRVELDNRASQKLAAYFEKQRDAEAKALAETQRRFWEDQKTKDGETRGMEDESAIRNVNNQNDIFKKEYTKNLCKVYDELDIPKNCRETANPRLPVSTGNYTVGVSRLGWKNIDRLVADATMDRQTTRISANGKTSTLTYNPWSAIVTDYSKYTRINVYNIPVEFNSYIKLNGVNGKYEYKLNADIAYQTVALAWTADGIYFFKAVANPGESTIQLRKVSDTEWRTEIKKSLAPVNGMAAEMDFTEHMQKDQKRVNANKEKTRLRQKIESVVFPCGVMTDTVVWSGVPTPLQ